jgi:hypothetical protein
MDYRIGPDDRAVNGNLHSDSHKNKQHLRTELTELKTKNAALDILQPSSQNNKAAEILIKKFEFINNPVKGKPEKTISLKEKKGIRFIDPKTPIHTWDVVIIQRKSGDYEYAIVSRLDFSLANEKQIVSVTFSLNDGHKQKIILLGKLTDNVFLLSKNQQTEYKEFMGN